MRQKKSHLVPSLSRHLISELVHPHRCVGQAQTATLVQRDILFRFGFESVVQMQTVVVESFHVDARVKERRQPSRVPR